MNEKKIDSKYGDSIVKRLSADLKSKYPDMGLSPRNLWNMKRFYLHYCQEDTKVQQAVALLPWSHNLLLMGYNLSSEHIKFYTNEIITKGWSREMLSHALKAEYQYLIPKNKLQELIADEIKNNNLKTTDEYDRSTN